MTSTPPKHVYLRDYQPPDFLIPEIELWVEIADPITRVRARLTIVANPAVATPKQELVLAGENMGLSAVRLDGELLAPTAYQLTRTELVLPSVPAQFELTIETELRPADNSALEGLYASGAILCTQNEPEGFRKITYFLDRPDVLSVYTTHITADRRRYPVLLANGNEIGRSADGDRHTVSWHDPFPKPCYLFALVAGDLGVVEDSYRTGSGRTIELRIYVDPGNEDRCGHAMTALKDAMRWDEDRYGLEYDLDLYMIVAVAAFNFGAMENKGLNIFNAQYVLADPATATDADFDRVREVIAHEYFHNWTGNRVTCRDWFQLTLKEGLTVYRDQEFTADSSSRPVKRINDVGYLREHQFPEDNGPRAHPIKPAQYIEINNFYTSTVYRKGAEVIRMIETLIGRQAFRRGIDRYFERFDGQAVTTEDFLSAMHEASGFDFTQFSRWYTQAGTPKCCVETAYDADNRSYSLAVKQSPAATAGPAAQPFLIPFAIGLIDADGADLPLRLASDPPAAPGTRLLPLSQAEQRFEFCDVPPGCVPSLARNFSAPITVEYAYSPDDLLFLLRFDSDEFNRFEAGQRLATMSIERVLADLRAETPPTVDVLALDAFAGVLDDRQLDCAFRARALTMPSVTTLVQRMPIYDYMLADQAREAFCLAFAERHQERLFAHYQALGEVTTGSDGAGRRALRNTALAYLARLPSATALDLLRRQFDEADNMTDALAALHLLCNYHPAARDAALQAFYQRWRNEQLVMNKWFAVQAGARIDGVLERIRQLEKDPAFDRRNPNKLRALFGSFLHNHRHFHAADGSGYAFIAKRVLEVAFFNPSVAARLTTGFEVCGRLDDNRRRLVGNQLAQILATPDLPRDVFEIASRILDQ